MFRKKLTALVILALMVSCTTPGQTPGTNNPSPVPSYGQTPTPVSTTKATQSPVPTQTPIASVSPIAVPTTTPSSAFHSLTAEELKKITESNIVHANNDFGLKLFKDLVKDKLKDNIFISPASIAIALQMTYNGAGTKTKDEMAATLGIDKLTLDQINHLDKLLFGKLSNPAPDITLNLANSLWSDKTRITFNPTFKSNLADFYSAQATELDFKDPKAPDAINGWVSDKTNQKITKVIDKIDDSIIAFIINAIYFKANWNLKFDKTETMDKDFTLLDGTTKKTPLMSGFRSFRYYNNSMDYLYKDYVETDNKFEVAEIPYGNDKHISMYIFLPYKTSSLEKFLSELNNTIIESSINKMYSSDGILSFPKFKMKWDKDLKDNLVKLGMVSAFQGNADFTQMGSSPLGNIFLAFVKHSTFVDVNEEGTEAAAVTVVSGGSSSSPPLARFVADRPFFYIIRDNDTKSIIFMGTVTNPEYSG